MKSRIALSVLFVLIAATAFAQSAAPKSDAEKSFDQMKTLAGTWEGHVSTVPQAPDIEGKPMQVSMRVTSMGHTLMHEATGSGRPDDPITMFVVDGDRLLLTHYCDADNRPRMVGKMSPDGKTVEFEFLDVTGNLQYGHMQHAVFTFIDANHHIEDWTFCGRGKTGTHADARALRPAAEELRRAVSLVRSGKNLWENLMDHEWNDSQPIYRQLRDRVVAMILDGVLKEGDPLPSVRNVAAEYRVNPLTVLKGYQELVDEGLVETRRGLGMFINVGARSLLLQGERQKFLGEEWPRVYATIQRLGLKAEELLDGAAGRSSSDAAPSKTTEPDPRKKEER